MDRPPRFAAVRIFRHEITSPLLTQIFMAFAKSMNGMSSRRDPFTDREESTFTGSGILSRLFMTARQIKSDASSGSFRALLALSPCCRSIRSGQYPGALHAKHLKTLEIMLHRDSSSCAPLTAAHTSSFQTNRAGLYDRSLSSRVIMSRKTVLLSIPLPNRFFCGHLIASTNTESSS